MNPHGQDSTRFTSIQGARSNRERAKVRWTTGARESCSSRDRTDWSTRRGLRSGDGRCRCRALQWRSESAFDVDTVPISVVSSAILTEYDRPMNARARSVAHDETQPASKAGVNGAARRGGAQTVPSALMVWVGHRERSADLDRGRSDAILQRPAGLCMEVNRALTLSRDD